MLIIVEIRYIAVSNYIHNIHVQSYTSTHGYVEYGECEAENPSLPQLLRDRLLADCWSESALLSSAPASDPKHHYSVVYTRLSATDALCTALSLPCTLLRPPPGFSKSATLLLSPAEVEAIVCTCSNLATACTMTSLIIPSITVF